MTRLTFTLIILFVAWFDMAYTLWAVRRYHFKEQNRMWNEAVYFPRSFVLRYTAYHVAALFVCWLTFPLELYWIVLAVRLFINAKNIAAVRRAR